MKNIIQLRLYGYTVQGTDRRDSNSSFEDHIVLSNLDGQKYSERIEKIIALYSNQGYDVKMQDITADDEREYNHWSDNAIPLEQELHDIWLQQQRAAGEDR